ncbi:MAG: hybrid sensor histidine kinase/response regulator, partial [Candidatus Acidiferrales bacterium]
LGQNKMKTSRARILAENAFEPQRWFGCVSEIAAAGKSLESVIDLGAWALLGAAHADRAGVWLDRSNGERSWEGTVASADSHPLPGGWNHVDFSTILSEEFFSRREPFVVDLLSNPEQARFGFLESAQKVIWLPLRFRSSALGVAAVVWTGLSELFDANTLRGIAAEITLVVAERTDQEQPAGIQSELENPGIPPASPNRGIESPFGAIVSNHLEAELRSVLAAVSEGVLLFDASGKVRFTNARFEGFLGFDSGKLSSIRNFDELVSAIQNQFREPLAFAERWRTLIGQGNHAVREELEMVRPTRKWIERVAHPVFDSQGSRMGRLELYQDITAQSHFQSRLLQTEKMAGLGQLVSGIAHELNNPLTAILGYGQLLLSHGLQHRQLDDAKKIYQEAERARHIVKNLLYFARETQPEQTRVELNELIERTLTLRRYELKLKNINVDCDLDFTLPPTMADPYQLQQLVLNLLANAEHALWEFRRQGNIHIRTWRFAPKRMALEISDDGPGIPAGSASRIFDPFFTTKAPGYGTGLGLSIVYGIVQHHGGDIYVENRAEGGARFVVELPILAIPLSRAVPAQASTGQLTPAGAEAGRILVVEDEPTVAQLIMDVLREEGHEVEAVTEGAEGLTRIARTPYDLVICDLRMPHLDGQAFYNTLVSSGSPMAGKMIFITGDTLAPRTLEFLEPNHLPYLAKPFLVEELKLAVNSQLAKGRENSRGAAHSVEAIGPPDAT